MHTLGVNLLPIVYLCSVENIHDFAQDWVVIVSVFLANELNVSQFSKVEVPLLLQPLYSQLHVQQLRATTREEFKRSSRENKVLTWMIRYVESVGHFQHIYTLRRINNSVTKQRWQSSTQHLDNTEWFSFQVLMSLQFKFTLQHITFHHVSEYGTVSLLNVLTLVCLL